MCRWSDKRRTHGAEMQHEGRFISVKSRMGSAAEAGQHIAPPYPPAEHLPCNGKHYYFHSC